MRLGWDAAKDLPSTPAELPLHQSCTSTSPELQLHCTKVSVPLYQSYNSTAPELQFHFTKAALLLHQSCSFYCTRVTLLLNQSCTSLLHFCNCLEMPSSLHCITRMQSSCTWVPLYRSSTQLHQSCIVKLHWDAFASQCPARVDIGSSRSEKWNENLVHSFREVKWKSVSLISRMKSEMKMP